MPIHSVPLLTRWLRSLDQAGIGLEDIFVVGNEYNHQMLIGWANGTQVRLETVEDDLARLIKLIQWVSQR